MKILYHHRIASKDGQYIHLSAIIKELKIEGHEVLLSGPSLEEGSDMGGQRDWIHFLKKRIPSAVYELMEFGYNFLDFFRLLKNISKFRPDFIYERENLYFVSGIWAAKVLKLPLILEVNAPLYNERAKYDGIYFHSFARWSENYVWRSADFLLPVTSVLENIVKRYVVPKQSMVLHNGISPKELEVRISAEGLRQQFGLKDKKIIGFVGFVRDWHKLDRIIDYIEDSKDPDLYLLIVGEGPECENLINYAAGKSLSNQMVMAGVVQREAMASYINIFDIAIQSAVTEYASPLKLFEYLQLGKVVVAPDSNNIKEIISDNYNGFLFDDSDKSSLFAALTKAMQPGNFEIGENARTTIRDKDFLWNSNARKIVSIAEQLMFDRSNP